MADPVMNQAEHHDRIALGSVAKNQHRSVTGRSPRHPSPGMGTSASPPGAVASPHQQDRRNDPPRPGAQQQQDNVPAPRQTSAGLRP
jgi:hypothetical protein